VHPGLVDAKTQGELIENDNRKISTVTGSYLMKLFRNLMIAATLFVTAVPAANATTIVDIAAGNPNFSTLVTAVKAAGLVDTLNSSGPFTVFAPTNAAFARLPKATLAALLKPRNKAKLAAILTYHVLSGKVFARDIAGKRLAVATVNGKKVHVNGKHGVRVNNARVVKADIKASNGVIHVIDRVLIP
jgi:uncharacterized surface protein with fasciclin (FAS1) repeats